MTQYLDPIETRLVQVMEAAYGGRPLTAGRFRRSIDNASLRDVAYPMGSFDCAYEIEWQRAEDWAGVENPMDGSTQLDLLFNLNVGHVYGKEASGSVSTAGSEVAATSVLHARKRALSYAEMIKRAFTYGALSGDMGSSVGAAGIMRVGATVLEDLGGGKLLSVTPYRLIAEILTATDYSP